MQQLELEKAELQSQISASGSATTQHKPEASAARPVATPTRSKEPEASPTRSKEPEASPTRSKEPEVASTRSKEPEVASTRSKDITPTRSKEPVFHSPVPSGPSLSAVLNGVEIKTQAHPVPKPSGESVGLENDELGLVNSQTHRKEYMKLAAWICLCGSVCLLHADHLLHIMSTCNLRTVAMTLEHWLSTPT